MPNHRKSFTLIELLVVLALVAILSVVVVMTLNPAELLKQARDSNRLSDLATVNTSLNLFSSDVVNGFMGTSSIVYVSIPDNASSTCGSLGLPTLPTGWNYNCVTSQNLRKTDGTGWIPVNFNRISSNSPISQLPIDPINTTSTRLYYTYIAGGSWELNATVEASKNKLGGQNDLVSKDGGTSPSTYELGNNLTLTPIETGDPSLVGYWNFEEGPNATSTDRSGYGNHGTWYGTSTQSEHYAAGKVGQYAGYFNGRSDYLIFPSVVFQSSFTWVGWFRSSVWSASSQNRMASIFGGKYAVFASYGGTAFVCEMKNSVGAYRSVNMPAVLTGQYYFFVFSYNSSNDSILCNLNMITSTSGSIGGQIGLVGSDYLTFGTYNSDAGGVYNFNGSLDDMRIYNRVLSSAEISALYNSTK